MYPNRKTSSFLKFAVLALTAILLNGRVAAEFSPRSLNLNADWRFIRDDVTGAEKPNYDAGAWSVVSCPHTWNDIDSFDDFGKGGHQGESDLWMGTAWYRKDFTLPAGASDKKVIIEFEGVRQIADVYLNGHHLGQDTTGFIPFAFDLTPHLHPSGRNVLAVKVNNTVDKQYTGGQPWNHQNWHPPHGGIYRNVRLHLLDPLHVTLPLHSNLGTEGVYAWTESLDKDLAVVGVTAEIENASDQPKEADINVSLVGQDNQVAVETQVRVNVPAGAKVKAPATLRVSNPMLWEPAFPYTYQVRVKVAENGVTRDVSESAFGIRSFRFDAKTGFWINGHPLKLHGWGQKPGQEWAGLGTAIPDWMHDFTLRMMKDAGGNMLRWGHCAGPPVGADSADKYGFVTLMPGVDGERDCIGEAWQTRTNAFRDLIIYYRNHPSICIWEGGNYNVSPEHAAEMRAIKEKWDPEGHRYFGFRMSAPGMLQSLDIELGTVGRNRALPMLPVLETEYDRTETPRRVWDRFSPPDFGKLGELADKNTYNLDSEGFATHAISEWWTLFGNVLDHSGGANWIFSDGTHGTRQRTDVARATGEVDAVRLPKEAYWALQAAWSDVPRVHLIGHWSYPKDTVKTMHAVARADAAELFVNGRSLGKGERSLDTLFTWQDVAFEPGEIKVVAYRDGKPIASQVKETAGEPANLRLTPVTAPGGWHADGSDIALVDFEVVDAKGRRCPTDEARVDFEITGPAVWRGGYNSGKEKSTNHLYLDTECGINRASLRSTLTAGEITLTATRAGLPPATLRLLSLPVDITDGLLTTAPPVFATELPPRPETDAAALTAMIKQRDATPKSVEPVAADDRLFSAFAYTGDGAGGMEDRLMVGDLAYSDSALLCFTELPDSLKDYRLIRTASSDSAYWANDYIVATPAHDLDFLVAHDRKVPVPKWLKSYQMLSENVKVNGKSLDLYSTRLKAGQSLRIPGNADQGKGRKSTLNLILLARPSN